MAEGFLGETPLLVGRLRRWHRAERWGYVLSDLHHADILLDASEAGAGSEIALSEGDFVFFELGRDEAGLPLAYNVRRAEPHEAQQQQDHLQALYQQRGQRCSQARFDSVSSSGPCSGSGASAPSREAAQHAQQSPHAAHLLSPQALPPVQMVEAGSRTASMPSGMRPVPRAPPPPPSQPPGAAGCPQALQGQLVQQTPYMAQLPQEPYRGYAGQGDQGYAAYHQQQQGAWPAADSAYGLGNGMGSVAGSCHARPVRLLLEAPRVLSGLEPEMVARLVSSDAAIPLGPAQTFSISRSGTAAQIGQDWVVVLREAISQVWEDPRDAERDAAQQASSWADQQWSMWHGQVDGGHGNGGDHYLGQGAVLPSGHVLGFHGGDHQLHQLHHINYHQGMYVGAHG